MKMVEMKIGEHERIVCAILAKYPKLNNEELQTLCFIASGKQIRIPIVLRSLRIKGLLDEKTNTVDSSIIEDVTLPAISLSDEVITNLSFLSQPYQLKTMAKSILYVLNKTQKASLQFLADFFNQPVGNIYAQLERLISKDLVVSYSTRIRRVNKVGRRYNPKYYVLTYNGQLWNKFKPLEPSIKKKIDAMLENIQKEISSMHKNFVRLNITLCMVVLIL